MNCTVLKFRLWDQGTPLLLKAALIPNPYTFLKSRFYIEFSCILVYLAQFTNITPNIFTMTYAVLGVLGAFLITINNDFIILSGLLILFTKACC